MSIRVIGRGIPFLLLLAFVAAGTVGLRGAERPDTGRAAAPQPVTMPAPDETIRYDGVPLGAITSSDSTSRYWAVQFTPDSLCSLKLGLIGAFVAGDSPICTFFVWQDSSDLPREPPVFQSTFSVSGLPGLENISVTPPLIDSLRFWIGYWLPDSGPDPLEQDLAAADMISPPVMSLVSEDRLTWDSVSVEFAGFYNLAIRAVVSYFPRPLRDVECMQIFGLPDTVSCDSGYALAAEVFNWGGESETFNVILEIDTSGGLFQVDTQAIVGLDTMACDTARFDTFWVPRLDGTSYGVLVYTGLAGDDSTSNDSLRDSTFGYCIWTSDVGVTHNLSPPAVAFCGSTYDVRARVLNYGNTIETALDVEALIDSAGVVIYADTTAVDTLFPGDSLDAAFDPWQIPPADSTVYEVRFTSLLPGDSNRTNDTLLDTTSVYCYFIQDVGPIQLVSPGDTVFCDSVYPVLARVRNFGTVTATFDVSCRVDSSGVALLDSTRTVTGLEPDSSRDVEFDAGWRVPLADGIDYGITVSTSLLDDDSTSNDTLVDSARSVCLFVHDVGPIGITVPDTVYCDSMYNPGVIVHNWGQVEETFGVELFIDSMGGQVYADTATASGVPPDTDVVVSGFTHWTVPISDAVLYQLRVRTLLSTDVDLSNDTLFDVSESRCLWREDVAPVLVVSPPETVYCDSSNQPAARVANLGQVSETFDAVLTLDTNGVIIYDDTASVADLPPGDTADVLFEPWFVPGSDSTDYGIALWTLLAGDTRPENDTLSGSTFGLCVHVHDVGAVGRVAPPDTVMCGEEYPVWAEVINYGTTVEDFGVICVIADTSGLTIHQDTSIVVGLEPDSSVMAIFDRSWTVPEIDSSVYEITFVTDLVTDMDPSNDTLLDSVYSQCMPAVDRDVGVLSILAPPDTVFCDSSTAVMAYVRNFGTRTEFFNVECIIDSGDVVYGDTGAAPGLLPGDSMLVSFLRWSVPPADTASYTVRVRTLLGADTVSANDSLSKTCTGRCLTFHDVGVETIVDPPDTVYVGSSYTPRADVHNWGTYTEDFVITCRIGEYADTQQVTNLEPGWSLPVFFDVWQVDSTGTYSVSVITGLIGDYNASNDSAFKSAQALTGLEDEYALPRIPLESGLLQNVPNPLSDHTNIFYQISATADATVSVYDLSGRLVKVLFEGTLRPGYYSARWGADDELGNPVPNGIYVAKLRVGKLITSKKLVVVR